MNDVYTLPVAVIGAGPVGLAAAAHLLQRGETPLVFEAGNEVGASIRKWQHVRMFSPWEFTVDKATVEMLESHGWQMPQADALPTGRDLLEDYLLPFAALPEVEPYIHLNTRVVAIGRRDTDKMKDTGRDEAVFVIQVEDGDGNECLYEARAVIDASGTWENPNPAGSGGLPAIGEKRNASHIAYGIPDVLDEQQNRYANKRVMVVGSGHSAINALLALAELKTAHPDTEIVWALRNRNFARIYGGGEDDQLPARGKLGQRIEGLVKDGVVRIAAPFRIREIVKAGERVAVTGTSPDGYSTIDVDEIIVATGSRPDLAMLRELRLSIDTSLESVSTLGPLIDPNVHSCGSVPPHGEAELRHPDKNFYIVGMKSYGRAPTFLLATGYEQVRSVVAALVGDMEAARDVRLVLPETGVCSTDLADEGAACCGSTSVSEANVQLEGVVNLNAIGIGGKVVQADITPTATRDCGCDDSCCV